MEQSRGERVCAGAGVGEEGRGRGREGRGVDEAVGEVGREVKCRDCLWGGGGESVFFCFNFFLFHFLRNSFQEGDFMCVCV